MIYWDTSCVLKLYAEEEDSAWWEQQALELHGDFVCSALLEAELACAFHAKEERKEIVDTAADALLALFYEDVRSGRFTLFPIGEDVMAQAGILSAACFKSSPSIHLRTLDALHLATAKILKCKKLATADGRMRSAALFLDIDLVAMNE